MRSHELSYYPKTVAGAAVILTVTVILIIAAYWVNKNEQPRIVTVDLKGILQEFIVKSAGSKLEGDALAKHVAEYTAKLDRLTNELAAQENLIIIPKNAVLAGGIDITPQIKSLLDDKEGVANAKAK